MKLNIRHLYAFYEVTRVGSVSAASHTVHLTQPAVTQAIAQIERYFCARLFTRSSAGMQMTSAGRVCAERVGRALLALNDGIAELRGTASGEGGGPKRMTLGIRMAHLRALAALAQHRNFTLAARASHMAQPTIHRVVRDLERLLEIPLFEKTSHGVVPTKGAENLARRAGVAFAELEQAHADVATLNGVERGRTVIGAMQMVHPVLIPDALIEFSLKWPEHSIAILSGTYEHLLPALEIGESDFLIGPLRNSTLPHDVVQEHLFDDPLAIIMRPDHPLARRRRVTAADLSSYPWIAPRKGGPLRPDFDALFQFAGIPSPQRAVECNFLGVARAFLTSSDRLMLLSPHQFRDELKSGTLAAIAPPGGPMVRPYGLTLRRDWRPTSTQSALLDIIRHRSRTVGAPPAPGRRRRSSRPKNGT
jgi:DNA-binding transcriptional LysR family regulator